MNDPRDCAVSAGPDADAGCALCREPGGLLVWSGAWMRLIRADDATHPAFYRIVWQAHRAEFSDLTALERASCMDAVVLVEEGVRAALQPDKVNLAALGNMVPHVHWHIVARWHWDAHWPQPIWAATQRTPDAGRLAGVAARLPALDETLRTALSSRFG